MYTWASKFTTAGNLLRFLDLLKAKSYTTINEQLEQIAGLETHMPAYRKHIGKYDSE